MFQEKTPNFYVVSDYVVVCDTVRYPYIMMITRHD